MLGTTILKRQPVEQENEKIIDKEKQEVEEIKEKKFKKSKFMVSSENTDRTNQINYLSYNDKMGVLTYTLGLLVIILSDVLASDGSNSSRSIILAGNAISFFSALFGIIFHWIFAYYAMKNTYRIIEFLLCTYIFASISLTLVWAFFIDTSEYKQMSLIGWLYYASDTYFQDTLNFGWLICLILMGGFNGLGINFARIVRAEKYISTNKTFYVYLAQPIIATVIGYLFLPEQFPIPGVFTIIGGLVWLVGQYLLSM